MIVWYIFFSFFLQILSFQIYMQHQQRSMSSFNIEKQTRFHFINIVVDEVHYTTSHFTPAFSGVNSFRSCDSFKYN